jgi:hypothetical protein
MVWRDVWDVRRRRCVLMAKTGLVLVRFVWNKVALKQVFLRELQSSPAVCVILIIVPIVMLYALST